MDNPKEIKGSQAPVKAVFGKNAGKRGRPKRPKDLSALLSKVEPSSFSDDIPKGPREEWADGIVAEELAKSLEDKSSISPRK